MFCWQGDQILTNPQKYLIAGNHMTVNKLDTTDRSIYKCRAHNPAGEDWSEAKLTVVGKC